MYYDTNLFRLLINKKYIDERKLNAHFTNLWLQFPIDDSK